MSHLGNIIRGIARTCKGSSSNFFADKNISSEFVTREEYDSLKILVLEIKAKIKELAEKENGKNT
jgi:hypothetical protein